MNNIQNIALANHCPLIGGPAVIKARTLLAGMGYKAWDFTDNCPPTSTQVGNGARLAAETKGNLDEPQVSLYPNPAKERFTITISGEASQNCTIEAINTVGAVVYRNVVAQEEISVSTQEWAAGIYLIKLSLDSAKSRTYKLVINH